MCSNSEDFNNFSILEDILLVELSTGVEAVGTLNDVLHMDQPPTDPWLVEDCSSYQSQLTDAINNPLALDLCKVYMDLFTDDIVQRFGIHYPMTAFFVNNGKVSTDITIVVPDPVHLMDLPSFQYTEYQHYYQEMKSVLNYLAEKWSVHIKFI